VRKLADLSRERSGAHKEGSFQLRGEEVAHLAKLLGLDMSRISQLLGKDKTRLSKLVGENIKANAEVNLGDARSGGYRPTSRRAGRTFLPTRREHRAHAPSKSCGVSLPGLSASNTMSRE
jgi:hypothetical protein